MNAAELAILQDELAGCLSSATKDSNIDQLRARKSIDKINRTIDAMIEDRNFADVKILTGICYQYYRLLYK